MQNFDNSISNFHTEIGGTMAVLRLLMCSLVDNVPFFNECNF